MSMTTVQIPGTDRVASFEEGRYCETAVYLHAADEPWYTGRVIGTVGHMVRHGAFSYGGEVGSVLSPFVRERLFSSPLRERLSAERAVLLLAEWALAS